MKKLLLLIIICTAPVLAADVFLGIATGINGDTLILTDNLKICVPNLRQAFVNTRNETIGFEKITFPLEAVLVTPGDETTPPTDDNDLGRAKLGITTTFVKVNKFFDVKDGRLVQKGNYR
jgi:hypothetical protein